VSGTLVYPSVYSRCGSTAQDIFCSVNNLALPDVWLGGATIGLGLIGRAHKLKLAEPAGAAVALSGLRYAPICK
jgi:hypothetical protein